MARSQDTHRQKYTFSFFSFCLIYMYIILFSVYMMCGPVIGSDSFQMNSKTQICVIFNELCEIDVAGCLVFITGDELTYDWTLNRFYLLSVTGKENTYIIQLITFFFEELCIHAFYQSETVMYLKTDLLEIYPSIVWLYLQYITVSSGVSGNHTCLMTSD